MSEHDAKRLRLLEAVAKAYRADALIYLDLTGGKGMAFAEYVSKFDMSDHGRAVLEALSALEEYDDQKDRGKPSKEEARTEKSRGKVMRKLIPWLFRYEPDKKQWRARDDGVVAEERLTAIITALAKSRL